MHILCLAFQPRGQFPMKITHACTTLSTGTLLFLLGITWERGEPAPPCLPVSKHHPSGHFSPPHTHNCAIFFILPTIFTSPLSISFFLFPLNHILGVMFTIVQKDMTLMNKMSSLITPNVPTNLPNFPPVPWVMSSFLSSRVCHSSVLTVPLLCLCSTHK